jgi:hypothetical protein
MKQIIKPCLFYLLDVPDHAELKPQILSGIKSMGVHSLEEEGQKISNTDWHLSSNYDRPYYLVLKKLWDTHVPAIKRIADIEKECIFNLKNYWFQQYKEGDYHEWHIHDNVVFSNVYYVDLPNGSSMTSFKMGGEEFEVPVKEGQILTFPSCFSHCSKPNKVGTKTVVSFNY